MPLLPVEKDEYSAVRLEGKSHNYVVSLGVCGGTRRLGKRTTAIIRSPDFPNNYRQIFTKLQYFAKTKGKTFKYAANANIPKTTGKTIV